MMTFLRSLLSPYPVGSIYISTNSTSPANLFGGTWNPICGRFLLGVGQNAANTTNYWGAMNANAVNFPAGELGGEPSHTLSKEEMPSHDHTYEYKGDGSAALSGGNPSGSGNVVRRKDPTAKTGLTTATAGSGHAHNNMPPYITVYMWERTA